MKWSEFNESGEIPESAWEEIKSHLETWDEVFIDGPFKLYETGHGTFFFYESKPGWFRKYEQWLNSKYPR